LEPGVSRRLRGDGDSAVGELVVQVMEPPVGDLSQDRRPRPTSLELFAGAGGLALGVQLAGFDPLAIVELDARAVQTLRANAPKGFPWPVVEGDVRKLEFHRYEDVDLLAAGPPCQPFSIGGNRLGRHDERDLVPETIRAVSEAKPRAFMIENVRGLTFPAAESYLAYSLAQLRNPTVRQRQMTEEEHRHRLDRIPEKRHEYEVQMRLLNAADFGVPQQRVRLFIVGVRRDMGSFEWPEPSHSKSALLKRLEGDEYWDLHGVGGNAREAGLAAARAAKSQSANPSRGLVPWLTVRDVFRRLGPPSVEHEDLHHRPIPGARIYRKHRGSILDLPGKTVKSGVHGTPGGEHIVVLDDGTHRYFTPREVACLQTFPDDFHLPSLRSVAQRQLGNAVPVTLAATMARHLLPVLDTVRG
jgi:DNA (cytosine-5)-methyltransferase 1